MWKLMQSAEELPPGQAQLGADLLVGDGDVRALMRDCNWEATPLGPPDHWPQSLRAIVRVMLTSRFAMWMAWGPELTFLCNDSYLPTVGIKRSWVIGSRSDKVWAEIWPDIGPRIDLVLKTGEATWDEALLLYLGRSGFAEETYHTFSYSPLADDAGTTRGMLCVVAEVTERVIGERQLATLRELGARLSAASTRAEVVSALQTGLSAGPRDLPFALAYLADRKKQTFELAAVHGLDRNAPTADSIIALQEAAGRSLIEKAGEGDSVVVDVNPAAVQEMPLRYWQKPPAQAVISAIRSAEGGSPVGYFVAGLNPHRALDGGYRGFIELLTAQLAAAIARADQYERERERADALTEIDRAKTAFFSNVSHEFRTPLTLMLGPLEDALAETSNMTASQRARLDAAHRNALRLLRLVNSLLDFSRIEAGRVQVSYRPIDLAALTADLASSFRSATDRANLRLNVDAPPLSQPVYVDRDMWEKIVLNLLSNAFKFTFEGEIAVQLREAGGKAWLVVRDSGIGIPADELPKLFDRFHRVEGAQGRSFEGSGIGLALVQELIRQHGGEITVESEIGRGTSFTVSIPMGAGHLPADRIEADANGASTAVRAESFVEEALRWLPGESGLEALLDTSDAREGAGGTSAPAEHSRVLLADDNADLRSYIARLLAERGYEVTTAADGEAALAAARSAKPDLLVTDVMMPRLDGYGLLRAVRNDAGLRDLPVIMLSARADEDAKVEGLDAGADDYLTKPFSARELLARVAANIAMSQVRREAAVAIRASEAEARAQAERVQLALDAGAIVGTWVWEVPQDRFVGDERFARSFGVDPERMHAGLSLSELMKSIHEDDRPHVAEAVAEVLGRGGAYRCEYRVRQPDGAYRWIEANGRVDLDEHGAPARFPGVLIDIDHRRRIEEELRALNEELETRVAHAIAEREQAEAALRQAQKMEAVGQLTGGIAHDFNNLLTIISGNVDMARRALASSETARLGRALSNAQKGAERAATLTQRLLAFSRRQPLAPKPLDADRLVAGMSDLLNRALGETIQLEIVSTPGLWRVEADPNQLENAIVNLAVNARDAMPQGGKLTIETANAWLDEQYAAAHAEVMPGAYAVIAVTDTGHGMSRDTLARVFDPFFTTKEVGKGTGLGLSMVYGFVKQSGGHVKIYSELGEGTTVRIYLPRLMRGGETLEEVEQRDEATNAMSARTILVVEDDNDVRAYTVEIIRELGYHVLEANDGPAALRLLKREDQRIDLLFTDVVMPGMSGRELADKAREIQPDLQVLYTSGYTRNAIVHGGRLDSGVEMIAKPFTYQSLSEKIADVIDAGRSGRALVVDADPVVRKFVIEALGSLGLVVDEAATASEALGRVRALQGRYDLVLIDADPSTNPSNELAQELRAMHADLPLLISSREHDEKLEVRWSTDRRAAIIQRPYGADVLQAAMTRLGLRTRR
jgi:PAS domain S-box-containing protein